jgi:NTP pyrophosphatase (non-canonical NTP hydrolase)/GTPase SAR1 family protein
MMFDEYQKQAARFFKQHEPLTAEQARLLNWGMGLSGEAGEVSEVIKHHIFGEQPLDKMRLAKEMGDVLWYVAALCTSTGIDFSSVAELNANKLAHRYGNEGYSDEKCGARHEQDKSFEDSIIYQTMVAKILHKPAPINVIFIGPDGSGKTTIAKKVSECLTPEGFRYHKCNYEQDDKPNLAQTLLASQTNVIYDRFYYPDDILYSRVQWDKAHPEGPAMDWSTDYWKQYTEVLSTLCNLNTVFIFLVASEEVLQQRSQAWKDDYIDTNDLHKICTLYSRWRQQMTGRPLIIFDIDSSDQTVDVIVHECVAGIHRAQAVFANMDAETFVTDEEKAYEAARKEEISVELDDNVVQLDVFKAGKENQDGTESDDPEV